MKKLFLTVICITVFYGVTAAQDDAKAVKEESYVKYDGRQYDFIFSWNRNIRTRPLKSHWTGLGLSFNNFLNLPGDVNMNLGKSCSFMLNLASRDISISNHFLFFTGLGMDFSHFRFKNNLSLQDIDGITVFSPDLQGRDYKSSRLTVYYITFPLMFEYQTGAHKKTPFFIQGGAEVLLKYYAKSKVEIETGRSTWKEGYGDLNILPINFRLAGRIGIGNFSFFAYYQPVSMFQKSKGPDIYPLGVGISIH